MYMSSNVIKRILTNPALGLVPYFIFSILIGQLNTIVALAIGFLLSILPLLFRMRSELRVLYDISAWSFVITALGVLFLVPDLHPQMTFILSEIVLVSSLMVLRLSRKSKIKRLRRSSQDDRKYYLVESFHVAFQTQYALTLHLIVILGFRVFFTIRYPILDIVLVLNTFQIILGVIIVLEALRLKLLGKRLGDEEWLPVVNESGNVQGKVAKSVSQSMKNKFLHPMVRVALIHDSKVYLRSRDETRLLDPGKLDYPFEKYMQYDQNIDQAVKIAIKKEIQTDELPVRFLLKYIFENEDTKRLIFLYVSNITSVDDFNKLHLEGGKLWTINQIDDNVGKDIFSECFELEFEYLKNTVLMINFPTDKLNNSK
ncbi:MAG: hypothetical protein PHI32_00090 [Dysgonamonadaceae bacterium]|nr:hypothetical protein [Dysgonamonadaceae bacterium]MDD4727656.1 hypothetical protein [Dysgonamonadaceae bacterium]